MGNGSRQIPSRRVEDVLIYLPRKTVTDYPRGQMIFMENQPSRELYLVIKGRVKVIIPLQDGAQTLVDVFATDDFFGESALLGNLRHTERAITLDNVSVMSWATSEIEAQVEREPRLGIALLQMLVRRALEHQDRLQNFALDKTPERVVRAVLRFADRTGTRTEDGSLAMPPLTHQLLSEYVGTSREIVTFHMNQLRQRGLLQYTRRGMRVYPQALRDHLELRMHGEAPQTT
ncbi:MAG TPA: Crp/Fnr family transcriptional regulator [Bryobacteraceae bacterium]|nr:Crp/Fnr family transcriptional regulator [Bryobacteraceae bacterium]